MAHKEFLPVAMGTTLYARWNNKYASSFRPCTRRMFPTQICIRPVLIAMLKSAKATKKIWGETLWRRRFSWVGHVLECACIILPQHPLPLLKDREDQTIGKVCLPSVRADEGAIDPGERKGE